MSSINKDSDPLDDFTEEQLANLDKSINTLDQEEKRWIQEQREAVARRLIRTQFPLIIKSPLEIINRV